MRRNLEEGSFGGVYSFRGLEPSDDDMSIFRGSMAAAGSHGTGKSLHLSQILGEESSENRVKSPEASRPTPRDSPL